MTTLGESTWLQELVQSPWYGVLLIILALIGKILLRWLDRSQDD